jgi:predicted nucleotidyltransferase
MLAQDRIKQAIKLDHEVINIYPYGSRVYGTARGGSDYDFIVVADCDHSGQQYDAGNLTVHLYNVEHWKRALEEHRIFALECLFLPSELKLLERNKFDFQLDHANLRKEISTVSSNSWVKAKKKIEVEHEHYLGFKSLFHCLRIPIFGTQIGKEGKITDYSAANYLWDRISNQLDYSRAWDSWKEEYQPIRNELLTEFRKYAEK